MPCPTCGHTTARRGRPPMPSSTREAILAMIRDGATDKDAAAAHGVSAPTAAEIRKAAGIAPLPNKGGAWRKFLEGDYKMTDIHGTKIEVGDAVRWVDDNGAAKSGHVRKIGAYRGHPQCLVDDGDPNDSYLPTNGFTDARLIPQGDEATRLEKV